MRGAHTVGRGSFEWVEVVAARAGMASICAPRICWTVQPRCRHLSRGGIHWLPLLAGTLAFNTSRSQNGGDEFVGFDQNIKKALEPWAVHVIRLWTQENGPHPSWNSRATTLKPGT